MVAVAEILARLEALGVRVEVRDGRLITRRPPEVPIPPDLAEAIRTHREELIALLTGSAARIDRFDRLYSAITTPEVACERGGEAAESPGPAQTAPTEPTDPQPERDRPLNKMIAEMQAAGIRVPELFRCPRCDAVCRAGPSPSRGVLQLTCPRCNRPAGTIEAGSAAHFLGLKLKASRPDPALDRALEKLTAELGDLEGYEPDLARAVLEAASRDPRPWPFNELDPVEWGVLKAWAEGAVGMTPKTEAGPEPEPANPGFRAKPDRCPTCGGECFYQPWKGPQAGLWFCLGCNPNIRPETEPFITGREELRDLANGVYRLAKRLDFPELELYPGRKIGPSREAWVEAIRRPLEAGYASRLWALLYTLEEAVSAEEERAYADKLLALAQALGYPEMTGDNRCPGPIRRIPAGAVSSAVAVVTMDPAERRYWLGRLKEASGAGQGH